MKKRILFAVVASACLSSSLMAKFTKLPSDCHYIYSKRTDYINKKDVKCIVKLAVVNINKNTPTKYGIATLNEAIPSGTSIIGKYTVTNRKKFNEGIKNGNISKGLHSVCKDGKLRLAFQQGLNYKHKFYSKSGKYIRTLTINQKSCGIK